MTLQRKTPLRGNPESHREWQRRSRERQIEAQRNGKARRARIKATRKDAKEKAAYIARVYGSRERLLQVKAEPCCVPGCTRRPCDNAHIENGGMGRKAGWESVTALCRWHHTDGPDSYHVLGSREAFDRAHNMDLRAEAAKLVARIPAEGRAD